MRFAKTWFDKSRRGPILVFIDLRVNILTDDLNREKISGLRIDPLGLCSRRRLRL